MGKPNWQNQTIWTGDNLDIMRGMNSESVDLVYLDPPFNSNKDYAAPIGSEAAGAAFKDTWTLSDVDEAWHGEIADRDPTLYGIIDAAGHAHGKSMKSYLIMMAVRLMELRRILKNTGSIYLHCDPTASHYLKTLLDAIFGQGNFRNEIVWKRFNFHADAKRYGMITDRILFYSRGENYLFNRVRTPYSKSYIDAKFIFKDESGRRYRLADLNPPGERGPVYEFHGITKAWRFKEDKMKELDSCGYIYTKSKIPQLKRYLDEMPGQAVADLWADISPINPQAKERTGYPTQKPLALLVRIVLASSNSGDVVLDPFCGCATACIAAEKADRQWIGIDISSKAFDLVKTRMRNELGLFGKSIHRTDIPQRTDLGIVLNYRTHKHTLFGKQEGICNGCRHSFQFRNFTIDHIVPQARGGSDHSDNLQLLCGACNSMKSAGSQEALIAKLKQEGIR